MKNYTITVNGTAYNVSVEEGASAAPAAARPTARWRICSIVPGRWRPTHRPYATASLKRAPDARQTRVAPA